MSEEPDESAKGSAVLLRALFQKLEQIQDEQRRQGTHLDGIDHQLEVITRRLDDADRRYEDLNGLVVGLVRQGQRRDRRLSDLSDELELAVKTELNGRLGMLQIELGHRFDDLATPMAALEGGDARRRPESYDH